MRRVFSYVVFCFWALGLVACSASLEQAVVGRYHGDADLRHLDPSLKEFAQKAMTGARSSLLEIKPNGRAKFSGIGKPIEGTWKLDGNILTLTGEDGQAGLKFEVKNNADKLVPILEDGQDKKLGGAEFWFKKE